MTSYEAKVKKTYENEGLKFLFDTAGHNSTELNKRAAEITPIPFRRIMRVQGDCINGERLISNWLMFAIPEGGDVSAR